MKSEQTASGDTRKGSILIDSLIAVFICAVVLTGVLPLFGKAVQYQQRLQEKTGEIIDRGNLLW